MWDRLSPLSTASTSIYNVFIGVFFNIYKVISSYLPFYSAVDQLIDYLDVGFIYLKKKKSNWLDESQLPRVNGPAGVIFSVAVLFDQTV